DILEKQVVPAYYDRGPDGVPRKWTFHMKNSIRTTCEYFNTSRMVQEYFEKFYYPAHGGFTKLMSAHGAGAKQLTAWKAEVLKEWPKVWIFDIKSNPSDAMRAGANLEIETKVAMGK